MSGKIKKIRKYLFDKRYRFLVNSDFGFYKQMDDVTYLKKKYLYSIGTELDLNRPVGYNEKAQWIKLFDRDPRYTMLVDKYEVKQYVASIIGDEYIIPTYGVWNSFDEIDFNSLPSRFVLKCTHDSGGIVICKNKSNFDFTTARKKINRSLKKNYYYIGREWPYKNVVPRVLAEEYIEDTRNPSKGISDYKFYCFGGKMKFVGIYSDRLTDEPTKADYFDRDFNWLDFVWGYEHAKVCPQKPVLFDEMIEVSEKLSKDLKSIRVDLYQVDGRILFGELTFFDGSGFDEIIPAEWDQKIGEWIVL